jgi:hypothetical protein
MISALEAALPPGSLAPWRFDRLDPASLELLRPEARALVLDGREWERALRGYRAVAGHFSLDTLLAAAPASAVCTVLREPRVRVLSLYMFWRTLKSDEESPSPAYGMAENANRPLGEFLSNRAVAFEIDNQVSRMLLPGDPRLPTRAFPSASDIEGVAADAIQRLGQFGYVGILELGESAWRGVGEHFGVTLQPGVFNVTGRLGSAVTGGNAGEVFTDDVLGLLEERTAADAIVYDYALERAGIAGREERRRLKERTFAAQLVRLGDLCGPSAVKAAEYDVVAATLERVEEELHRKDEELVSVRRGLEAVRGSMSWRVTAPLRSAKRWARGPQSERPAGR